MFDLLVKLTMPLLSANCLEEQNGESKLHRQNVGLAPVGCWYNDWSWYSIKTCTPNLNIQKLACLKGQWLVQFYSTFNKNLAKKLKTTDGVQTCTFENDVLIWAAGRNKTGQEISFQTSMNKAQKYADKLKNNSLPIFFFET